VRAREYTHEHLGVDETEGVDDDLSFDGLDGIDDDGDSSRVELLEGLSVDRVRRSNREHVRSWRKKERRVETDLLRVYIDGREPATKTWVGMIPANDHLRSIQDEGSAYALLK
jgi:hypothetical protein